LNPILSFYKRPSDFRSFKTMNAYMFKYIKMITKRSMSKPIKKRKMIQAQLKSNFSPTFLLTFKKETDVEERESLQLERKREF
jgi:hypothetical protein